MKDVNIRLICLLQSQKSTTVQLTKALGISDPRRAIKRLRDSGIEVYDEWKKNSDGNRYKVYWIKNKQNE